MSPRHERNRGNPEVAVDELLADYNHRLNELVENHQASYQTTADEYQKNVKTLVQQQLMDRRKFETALTSAEQSVSQTGNQTSQSFSNTLEVMHIRLTNAIPEADQQTWADVQRNALTYGVGSQYVKASLSMASSSHASRAMRAALDEQVWGSVQRNALTYGVGSQYVKASLSMASSSHARTAMQQLLPGEQRPQPNDFGFNGSVDDLLRGMFDDNFRQSGGATPPPQPPRPPQTPRAAKSPNPEQSSQDQALAEIRIIVARVTANDRQFAWLANEDPANVLRVVNTVKKLRATAAAKQETITDKAIYIRYRRSIENNNPDKTLEVSFRILDALMGGKVNGSLPF